MVVEHSGAKALQSANTGAAAVFYQGRALSSAEMLGLPDERPARESGTLLFLSSWIVALLVVTVSLVSLAVLFAAPLLSSLSQARSKTP